MRHKVLGLLLAFTLAGVWVLPGWAGTSKLDPRARIALAQLRGGVGIAELEATGAAVSPTGDLDVFIRGSVSRADLEALGVQVRTELPGLFTANVPPDAIDQVAALDGVSSIRGSVVAEPYLNVSVPIVGVSALRGAGPTFTGLNGSGVIVGDVDTGVDIHHGDFKDASNLSRILYIWDQTVTGTPPSPYAYGTEWTKAQIDGGTCTETDVNGHGTHVMGIAAGDGSLTGGVVPAYTYAGMAPKADIIEVKTTSTTSAILDGVAYIFGKATALGKNAVCNISLGSQFGQHDGTSDFESGLTSLVGPGRVIAVSAGNDRGSQKHAAINAAGTGSTIRLIVSGSANNRMLAIDGYYNATENLSVKITSPAGTVIGPIALGSANATYPGATYTGAGRVYVENGLYTTPSNAQEVYMEITGLTGNSISGTWQLTFIPVSLGASNGHVDLWRYYTSTTSLLATFDMANGGTDTYLVSEPGNATGVITVAAFETKNGWTDCGNRSVSYTGPAPLGAIATFSSPGPSRDGRQKPDLAAPGMGIGSTRSWDVTSACPTSAASSFLNDAANHTINQGTSMAAPHVTGAVALLMQKYGAITPGIAESYLFSHAIVDTYTGAVWNADYGRGKLFLGDLLDPTVAVTYPNGGEILLIGNTANLTWNATDNVGVTSVDLLLSRDGGATYMPIASGVPNTGSYLWTVTGPQTNNARLKVVAYDAAANTGFDVSDADWAIIDSATPTLMALFTAETVEQGIAVRWQFGDPNLYTNVRLERSESPAGPFTAIASNLVASGEFFTTVDQTVVDGHTYWYRVVAAVRGGTDRTFGPIAGTAGTPVTAFALGRVTPNPSHGLARIDFALPHDAQVRLHVVDIQGREVALLAQGRYTAGRYQATWNGSTNHGRAAAGLYFIRLAHDGGVLTQRVVLAP